MRPLVPVALALLALLGTACGTGGGDSTVATPTTTTESPSPDSARDAAPGLAGTTLQGETVALVDFRGRPVLINVWSSW